MTEPVAAGQPGMRAFLQVAGNSLAQHQLAMVLALDCQRVVCTARAVSQELIALQHAAEDAGLLFHVATSTLALAGLVTAKDELIVITEGLLAEPAAAAALLEGKSPLVVVQPVEAAVAQGFERIDLNRAAAGLLRVPGYLVEQLQALPADANAASALTRLALQAGYPTREVPASARTGAGWRMIRSEAEAQEAETEWLRACLHSRDGKVGGKALARFTVLSFGASLLHAGNASMVLGCAALGGMAVASALGWLNVFWAAFLVLAMAAVFVETARMLSKVERRASGRLPPALSRGGLLVLVYDLAFLALLVVATPRIPRQSFVSWLFVPLIFVASLKLVTNVVRGRLAHVIADRMLWCLLFALLSAAKLTSPGTELVTLGLVLVGLTLAVKRQD